MKQQTNNICGLCGFFAKRLHRLDGKIIDLHKGFWGYGGRILYVCDDCRDWYLRLNRS